MNLKRVCVFASCICVRMHGCIEGEKPARFTGIRTRKTLWNTGDIADICTHTHSVALLRNISHQHSRAVRSRLQQILRVCERGKNEREKRKKKKEKKRKKSSGSKEQAR
jgi:hypothetical protein